MTKTGSGASANPKTAQAVSEAVQQATSQLAGQPPTLGFMFASPKHDLSAVLKLARQSSPGTEFVGCHTAGEFTERGLTRGGLAVMLLSAPELTMDVQVAGGIKAGFAAAAKRLSQNFAVTAKAASTKGMGLSTTVLLVDGLSGTGEKLVRDVLNATRPFQQIVGGAAGDDGAFKATQVGARQESAVDSAVAVHIFDRNPWGVGVDHGLSAKTVPMKVTRARDNVVFELDGRPAFEAYQAYAKKRGVELKPATAGQFLIGNELGVHLFDKVTHARAPLSVGPAGELTCAADINEGARVSILDGEPEAMVRAAKNAAQEALASLGDQPAAGVLVFDCVCRGMILDTGFQKEIDAIRSVFPGVPVAGFLTYGEIARYKGKLDGWHNTTAVVAAIPA